MNKGELIDALVADTGLTKRAVGDILDALIDQIQREVKAGRTVSLPGFGTFEKRRRNARTGRNPQTGEAIEVAAADVPAFKPATRFKETVKVGSGQITLQQTPKDPTPPRPHTPDDD